MVKEVVVRFGDRLQPSPARFKRLMRGRTVISVERRAKLLRLRLSGGWNLFVHLKMTGRLLLKRSGSIPTKHTHLVFRLSGRRELHWEDVRKFGYMKALPDAQAETWLAGQDFGPEPLRTGFTWRSFAMCLRNHPKAQIKPLLLRQDCIAGIGNIYATEALWSARIHPLRRVERLSDKDLRRLHRAVTSVLRRAVKAGGTSADDYLDIFGEEGGFVPQLKVYGREGRKCRRCRGLLRKMRIGGRGTVICPTCQKKG